MTARYSMLMASTAILAATALQAQEQPTDLGLLVVSGSLSPVEEGRTGSSIEVVNGAQITERDTRVLDSLARLPGVSLTSNGGLGGVGTLQVRGLPARYVGMRINGINVSDPSGVQNQFDFGTYTGAGIDRIEVLKGSQSALYGSEAIAGVVDVTTYRPSELGFSGVGQIELGSFGTYSSSLSTGFANETTEIAATFGYVESDGISARSHNEEEDGFQQNSLSFTVSHDLSDVLTIGGALLYRDSDTEIDGFATSDGENFTLERGARVYATFETGATIHTFSYDYFDIDRHDPTGFTRHFRGERKTLSYLGSSELAGGIVLNYGLDHIKEGINNDDTSADGRTSSAKVEALFSPSAQFDLSAALRYDENSDFGGHVTGRLAAAWRPSEDWTIRSVLGTGYRAPSLYERFGPYGDQNLTPETSRSFEIGVERGFGGQGSVKATVFHTNINDLIGFDGGSNVCGSGFGCYNQVPGTTTSKGVELSGEMMLGSNATLFGAYTYTNAKTDETRLTKTPRHDFVIGAEADFSDKMSGYVNLRSVADVEASAFAPAGHLVGDYVLVNAGASYDITDTAAAYLRIENLLDEQYETSGGFNQPGRAVYFGIRAEF